MRPSSGTCEEESITAVGLDDSFPEHLYQKLAKDGTLTSPEAMYDSSQGLLRFTVDSRRCRRAPSGFLCPAAKDLSRAVTGICFGQR